MNSNKIESIGVTTVINEINKYNNLLTKGEKNLTINYEDIIKILWRKI